jgi:hypothetical protein
MDYFLVKMKNCNTGIQEKYSRVKQTQKNQREREGERERENFIPGFRKIREFRGHNLHLYLPRRMYLHSF